MWDGLVLGTNTAILLPPMALMLLVAAVLPRPLTNRLANRVLAVLLLVLTGIVTPWAIGFAGFYDRWPWLSFAPFSNPWAVAPLFWFYLHALVKGRLPDRPLLHLAPALAMFAFNFVSFLLPFDTKMAWVAIVGELLDILVPLGILAGFAFYGRASWKLLNTYRVWIADRRSDDNRFAARWLSNAIVGALILLAVWTVYEATNMLVGLSYSGLMGLYVTIAVFGAALALEGWRHAHLPFPTMSGESHVANADQSAPKDWQAEAEQWATRIREDRLYEDPEISLSRAARHLATNQSYLSRAINEGLGMNWSTLINSMRSQAVAARLESEGPGSDILAIALECGFNSKASFNRFFRSHYDMTPSAYRRQKSQNT